MGTIPTEWARWRRSQIAETFASVRVLAPCYRRMCRPPSSWRDGAGILRFALNDTKINAEGGESARGILNRARKCALCEDPHLRSSPILGERGRAASQWVQRLSYLDGLRIGALRYIPTVCGFWIESGACRLVLRGRRLS